MDTGDKTVLFLGVDDTPLIDWLREHEQVIHTPDQIDRNFINAHDVGFIVSYGYRHILGADLLAALPDRAINLHISLLPWNRGADPNFWSFLEDTPKGVTIHYMDEGIDTGDIIVQRELRFDTDADETLASTYRKLRDAVEALFRETWPAIRSGDCPRFEQSGTGSYHTSAELDALWESLPQGWDTPIARVRSMRARTGGIGGSGSRGQA